MLVDGIYPLKDVLTYLDHWTAIDKDTDPQAALPRAVAWPDHMVSEIQWMDTESSLP